LRSHRGITGGYSLGRAAAKITIRDIVEVLEGIDVNRCSLALTDECPVLGRCAIQKRLTQLEENFLQSLATVSIADLAKGIVTTPPKTPKLPASTS
jgi:DNA-binding IscR family transcriptional regulator